MKTIIQKIFFKISKFTNSKILRKRYLVNLNSKEIHDLKNPSKVCSQLLYLTNNKIYISEKQLSIFLDSKKLKFNGCKHCLKKYDTD
jgi:hypothetical protein